MSLILDGTNGLSDVDGTAATPAIRGTDANTGIFFPAADTIAFSEGGAEAMRIDSSGNLLVGKTTTSKTTQGIQIGATAADFVRNAGNEVQNFWNAGTGAFVGQIVVNASSTSYVTSSDYRLKENVAPMQNALTTVAALKPCTYTWKADSSAGQGFIAHELQAVVPDCVTGEKDAVSLDGSPMYQGVDTSFLVATLVAAIQELKAEVDALKEIK